MASNRYASHLSGCIGIGTGTRRGAARGATSKSKYGVFLYIYFVRFDHSDTFLSAPHWLQARFGGGTLGLAIPSLGERKRV